MRIENVTQHLTSRSRSQSLISGDHAFKKQENMDAKQHGKKQVHVDDVKQAVHNLNKFIEPLQTNLKFQYHEDLNEYYVEVVNPMTDEVIREIPPKKLLDMYAAMADFMGLLIDKKI